MTVASAAPLRKASIDRGHLRRERQARVGILRNTNAPPKPPARRAALTGKWPSLRSSRRAAPGVVEALLRRITGATDRADTRQPDSAAPAAKPAPAPVRTDAHGTVTGVDIYGLMRAAGTGPASGPATGPAPTDAPAPARVPFAAEYLGAVEHAAEQEEARKTPAILRPETWRDLAPRPQAAPPRPVPAKSRPGSVQRLRRAVGRALSRAGVAVSALLIALFLALLFLQLMSPVQL